MPAQDASMPVNSDRDLRWRWLRYTLLCVRSVCLAIGVAFLIATFTPLDHWWTKAYTGRSWHTEGDVLVVLGGGGWAGGEMAWDSYLRAAHAAFLYRGSHFSTIVVTGGGKPPVALAMRDYLVSQGVPASAVVTETGSQSTHENAVYCKPILDRFAGRKILLTSDYHIFRAVRSFRTAGIDVLPSPVPDAAKQYRNVRARWSCFLELLTETGKIVYYKARGWI